MKEALTSRQHPSFKITLDLILSMVFMVALGFRATGGSVHEWIGLLWCMLVLVHCWWNRRWFTVFFRGKYSFRRTINAAAILFLALGILTIGVTGLMNSSHILGFLNLDGDLRARQIHTIASYWSLVLAGIHVGIHWKTFVSMLHRNLGWPGSSAFTRSALRMLVLVVAFAGIWASFDRGMGAKLFYGSAFDFWNPERSIILFFAANLAILSVYAIAAHIVFSAARKKRASMSAMPAAPISQPGSGIAPEMAETKQTGKS